MKKQLDIVLDNCLRNGHTFTLFVQGSLYEDMRRLLGYQIEGQRKVILGTDQVSRFSLRDFSAAMNALLFDFSGVPQESTKNNFAWQFTETGKSPKHIEYMRQKAEHGVAPQPQALKPQLKEFSLV